MIDLYFALALFALAIPASVAIWAWSKKPSRPPDPVTRIIILTIFFVAVILVLVYTEILPKDFIQQYWWIFIAVVVGYIALTSLAIKKVTEKPYTHIRKAMKRYLDLDFKEISQIHASNPFPLYNVIDENGTKIAYGMTLTKDGEKALIGVLISSLNLRTKIYDPSWELVKTKFGGKIASEEELKRILKESIISLPEHPQVVTGEPA